jgi:hypothetical protein
VAPLFDELANLSGKSRDVAWFTDENGAEVGHRVVDAPQERRIIGHGHLEARRACDEKRFREGLRGHHGREFPERFGDSRIATDHENAWKGHHSGFRQREFTTRGVVAAIGDPDLRRKIRTGSCS